MDKKIRLQLALQNLVAESEGKIDPKKIETALQRIEEADVPETSDIMHSIYRTLDQDIKEIQEQDEDNTFLYWDFKVPRAELTLLCAYTGHGKTVFAIDLAVAMKRKGLKVAFITCEMDSKKIRLRMTRNILNHYTNMKNLVETEIEEIKSSNFDVYDATTLDTTFTFKELKALIDSLVPLKYDAIFLDYIQIIDKPMSENMQQLRIYYKDIAAYLQKVAQKNNIFCICTAQTNRDGGKKHTALENSNIAESSDIIRNAGYVIGIYKMSLIQRHSLLKYEEEEFNKFQEDYQTSIIYRKDKQYTELVYLKEQKTRKRPIAPFFRLLNVNYGLCKVINVI